MDLNNEVDHIIFLVSISLSPHKLPYMHNGGKKSVDSSKVMYGGRDILVCSLSPINLPAEGLIKV